MGVGSGCWGFGWKTEGGANRAGWNEPGVWTGVWMEDGGVRFGWKTEDARRGRVFGWKTEGCEPGVDGGLDGRRRGANRVWTEVWMEDGWVRTGLGRGWMEDGSVNRGRGLRGTERRDCFSETLLYYMGHCDMRSHLNSRRPKMEPHNWTLGIRSLSSSNISGLFMANGKMVQVQKKGGMTIGILNLYLQTISSSDFPFSLVPRQDAFFDLAKEYAYELLGVLVCFASPFEVKGPGANDHLNPGLFSYFQPSKITSRCSTIQHFYELLAHLDATKRSNWHRSVDQRHRISSSCPPLCQVRGSCEDGRGRGSAHDAHGQ